MHIDTHLYHLSWDDASHITQFDANYVSKFKHFTNYNGRRYTDNISVQRYAMSYYQCEWKLSIKFKFVPNQKRADSGLAEFYTNQ